MTVFELTRNMVNLLVIVNLNSWLSETIDKRLQSQPHLLKIKKLHTKVSILVKYYKVPPIILVREIFMAEIRFFNRYGTSTDLRSICVV